MAEEGSGFNLFPPGSIVSCRSCHGEHFQGEVLAFDCFKKSIIMKVSASAGRSTLMFLNLNLVEDIKIVKEAEHQVSVLPNLNVDKLESRLRSNIEERSKIAQAIIGGVSPEGIELYQKIIKTLDEVSFDGLDIVVMNQVTISPPYRPENCKGKADSDALTHVRNIVDKHIKDQQAPKTQVAS